MSEVTLYLQGRGEGGKAVELLKVAVGLEPSSGIYRVTPKATPPITLWSERILVGLKSTALMPVNPGILRGRHHTLYPFYGVGLVWCVPVLLGCRAAPGGGRTRAILGHPPWRQPGADLKSISHRCYLREVVFEWELTQETICLPLSCLQGGNSRTPQLHLTQGVF